MSRTLQALLLLLLAGTIVSRASNVPDGPHSCRGEFYPYPFGIVDDHGKGDFLEGFEVVCGGEPFAAVGEKHITSFQLGNISLDPAEVRALLPVAWQCYDHSGGVTGSEYQHVLIGNDSVYRISNTKNDLYILGCNTLGYLGSKPAADDVDTYYTQATGCLCYCDDSQSAVNGDCTGVGCCRADIPPDLVDNDMFFGGGDDFNHSYVVDFSPCDYAFVVQKGNYSFQVADLNMHLRHGKRRLMPVTLDWAIGRDQNLTCKDARRKKGYACKSSNSLCLDATNGPGYTCKCRKGYEGNPYLDNGCTGLVA